MHVLELLYCALRVTQKGRPYVVIDVNVQRNDCQCTSLITIIIRYLLRASI